MLEKLKKLYEELANAENTFRRENGALILEPHSEARVLAAEKADEVYEAALTAFVEHIKACYAKYWPKQALPDWKIRSIATSGARDILFFDTVARIQIGEAAK